MDDDVTCTDADCSPCCLVLDDDSGNCGACCDGCASSGDGCCLFLGDSLCWCQPETPAVVSDSGTASQAPASSIIQSQPIGPTMGPILHPNNPALHNHSNEPRQPQYSQYSRHHHKFMQQYKRCSFPSLRVVLVWLFALAVIAAIGVTLWLTRNIPFGTNCGNAHRALLGVLLVIVVGGICMPIYYKYIQSDLVVKELHLRHQALLGARSPQELSIISRNTEQKRSVVASVRFSLALKVTTLILILVVALGYYYLWSKESQCLDNTLWIVKGWFIALLAVAILVMALMLSTMFRAVKEKHLLNTTHYNLGEDDTRYNGTVGLNMRERTSAEASTLAPPSVPSTPSSVAPPAYTGPAPPTKASLDQPRRAADQRERAQIEKALDEQLDQQQQQQHQNQNQTDHFQAGYGGASGTGAYC